MVPALFIPMLSPTHIQVTILDPVRVCGGTGPQQGASAPRVVPAGFIAASASSRCSPAPSALLLAGRKCATYILRISAYGKEQAKPQKIRSRIFWCAWAGELNMGTDKPVDKLVMKI
jgi:hypothetical protein